MVASPNVDRGHIPKAFVVSARAGNDEFIEELQQIAQSRLSRHEYPRAVAFVDSLPKLPAGKINRKALREQEIINQENHS